MMSFMFFRQGWSGAAPVSATCIELESVLEDDV